MLEILILTLFILWLLGYINISGIVVPNFELFVINGHPITLWNVLTLVIIGWIIGLLPSPFRQIASVFLVLWVLSILGILAFTGVALSNIIVLLIIVGLVGYVLSFGRRSTRGD